MSWETILDPAFSLRVCVTLAHSIWQVALFAAIAWGLDRLWRCRSVERSYALHVAALLAGLAAMPVTYAIVDVGVSGAAAQTETAVASLPASPPVPLNLESEPSETGRRKQASKADAVSPGPDVIALPSLTPADEEPLARWLTLAPWIVSLYAAGVLFMLARRIMGMWHARRLASRAELIYDGALVERLNRLARTWSMRIVPLLARADGIVVPKVVGLVRPMILLPVSAVTCLSTDELEMILAHELAHVRRFDTWVNLAQRVAEVVLFFNPALWYLSRRTSALREYCCDELTCRATSGSDAELRTRYASALVRIVELARPALDSRLSTLDNPFALAAAGRSPSDLRRRVARLFGEPIPEPVRLSRGGLLAIAVLAAVLLIAPTTWHSAGEFAAAPTTSTGKDAAETRPVDAKGQESVLILNVDKEGNISVHGRPVQLKEYIRLEAMASFLNARRTQPDLEFGQELPTTVVIRADRATPYRVLHGVITECLQNGFRKFVLKAMNQRTPDKTAAQTEKCIDRMPATNGKEATTPSHADDLALRYAEAAECVAKAAMEKAEAVNRSAPGTVPQSELRRLTAELRSVRLKVEREKAVLRGDAEAAARIAMDLKKSALELAEQALATAQEANRKVPGTVSREELDRLESARRAAEKDVKEARPEAPSTVNERAIAGGLNWLGRHQLSDGRWSFHVMPDSCKCSGAGAARCDAAATGLAVLAFLGAGQTHKSQRPYRDRVQKGIDWLLMHQDRTSGDLGKGSLQHMFEHGIATLALCEAYELTKDLKLREPADQALRFIQAAQNKSTGGWGNEPGGASDTAVTAWQVMALKSGQIAGFGAEARTVENVRKWLTSVRSGERRGLFQSRPGDSKGATPAMTAAGMLCQQYLGMPRDDPAMLESQQYLLMHLPAADGERNVSYWHFGTMAMHNIMGPEWDRWNRAMRRALIQTQAKGGCAEGSWDPHSPTVDPGVSQGGRLMATTLSVLSLEVYYRYLPLYRLNLLSPTPKAPRTGGL